MGTGVNGQIIGTSNFWRFEFLTGLILLIINCSVKLLFNPKIGIVGAGISNFIAYTIYNIIRLVFLWKKFKMQPFSVKTFVGYTYGTGIILPLFILFYSSCMAGLVLFAREYYSAVRLLQQLYI